MRAYQKDNKEKSFFIGSQQNEPEFKRINLAYPDKNTTHPEKIINKNIQKIKDYPNSVYILNILFYTKEYFTDPDLKKQLSYFTNDVKNTTLFKRFNDYFKISATFDKVYPSNIQLENNEGTLKFIDNQNSKYHLVVFWASWCAPCRKEIPELKKIYTNYKNQGLKITSISLDDNRENWMNALQKEQMPWEQFIAIDSTRKFMDEHYNIKTIPKAYLYNKQKELIEKFEGYSPKLEKIIEDLFNKK